jgi:hypothetical protein
LVHRQFNGTVITLGERIGDLNISLKCELLGNLVTLHLSPTLHEPVDQDSMDRTENRIAEDLK